jgi:alkylated DNA repair dioxygenase AlkB
MSVAHQPSMWDLAGEAVLGPLEVVRHRLGNGAWVDHLPGWVQGSDEVLQVLLGDIGWRADRRQMYEREVAVPRLLRWYGGDEPLPHPLLAAARHALTAHYGPELGEPFVSAGMCLYRDGRDSVAWHGDRIGRGRSVDTMVAIVSFGSPRPLLLRPVGGGERACGSPWATGTWWSWAAPASGRGSTASRRPPGPSARGSASSSVPAASPERWEAGRGGGREGLRGRRSRWCPERTAPGRPVPIVRTAPP